MPTYIVEIKLNTETEAVFAQQPAVTIFGTFANITRNRLNAHRFLDLSSAEKEGVRATRNGRTGTFKIVEQAIDLSKINLSKSNA